jgi:hypothetical protein
LYDWTLAGGDDDNPRKSARARSLRFNKLLLPASWGAREDPDDPNFV